MFNNTAHRRMSITQRLRAGSIFLAIALVLGSTGQTTRAVAAPQDQVVDGSEVNVNIEMRVIPPRDPICVGQRNTVQVIIIRTGTRTVEISPAATDTEWVTVGRISYVMVEASVQDESIGTISPGRLQTGYDPENDNPQADFTFAAKKVGTTKLFFEALVPKRITGGSDAYISQTIPVKVVNCDYRVTMTYNIQQGGSGYFSIIQGKVDTLIKREGDGYKGSGTLATLRLASMAPCGFTSSGFYNPTTFTGTLVEARRGSELQLNIQFEPGTHTDFISCPVGAGGGTETVNPAGYLKTSATFSENGGTTSFLVNFAGWEGTQVTTVVPVNSSGQ